MAELNDKWRHRVGWCIYAGAAFSAWAWGAGGIQTDGSVGANGNWLGRPQSLNGKEVTITQEMGATAGRNLFHSFAEFNISKDQTVTFTGDSALSNVISRVTGKSGSDIDGTLRSTIGKADFYLINPNGVTFGPNAQVDVPAAFHVSTADEIKFKDGARFSARDLEGSKLTADDPAAFGFLETSAANNGLIAPEPGGKPASIAVDGTQLAVKSGETLDITAGAVVVENGARLAAEAGEIRLVAIRGQGAVSLEAPPGDRLSLPKEEAFADNAGDVRIAGSALDVNGDGAGRIGIYGNKVGIDGSVLTAHNSGTSKASVENGIHIRSGALAINFASLLADAEGLGRGADISIETSVSSGTGIIPSNPEETGITLQGGRVTTESHDGGGDAGSIRIAAGGKLKLTEGARVASSTKSSEGAAGTIQVSGRLVHLSESVLESSSVGARSSGKTGDILINAKEKIALDDSTTLTMANGAKAKPPESFKPNLISFNAPEIEIQHASISTDTDGAFGAGEIQLEGQSVSLKPGAELTSSSRGEGDAGLIGIEGTNVMLDGAEIRAEARPLSRGGIGGIRLKSSETLSLTNQTVLSLENTAEKPPLGGFIEVQPGVIELESVFSGISIQRSTLTTRSTGGVAAGQIIVTAPERIELLGNSTINTSALGAGRSGPVDITSLSGQIVVDQSSVLAESKGPASGGKTGDVNLSAKDSIRIRNATVSATNEGFVTDGSPKPEEIGSVSLKASDILLDHANLLATTSGNVKGGSIKVDASGNLQLGRQSAISATTTGAGSAGSVDVSGQSVDIDGSEISAAATNPAPGVFAGGQTGNVTVSAQGSLRLASGGRISVTNQGIAAKPEAIVAGQIKVSATDLSLEDGHIQATTSGNVKGGSVSVVAGDSLAMTRKSTMTASTTGAGAAGSVEVSASQIDIDDATITAESNGVGSSGLTGNVSVVGNQRLRISNGGRISIANEGVAARPDTIVPTRLSVAAPDIALNQGSISAKTFGNVAAGSISINDFRALQLTGDSAITSATAGLGGAGTVTVNGGTIDIDHSSISAESVGAESSGRTGNVSVFASDRLSVRNFGSISIANEGVIGDPAGISPGRLSVAAPEVRLDRGSISAKTSGNVAGGSIDLTATGDVQLTRQSEVTAATTGSGAAGTVTVQAARIGIDNSEISAAAQGVSSSGQTGNLTVSASERVDMRNRGAISIANQGMAAAPLDSPIARLIVAAPDLLMDDAAITATTSGNVSGGSINVDATRSLSMRGDSSISSSTTGAGGGGAVAVRAGEIDMDRSSISAASIGPGSSGKTGNVTVAANTSLAIRNLGAISVANDGVAAAPASVTPGRLTVTAPVVQLAQGQVLATTSGNVSGGSIDVQAGKTLVLTRGSAVSASTSGAGAGGAVRINAGRTVSARDNSVIAASTSGTGDAGSVLITTGRFDADHAVVTAQATPTTTRLTRPAGLSESDPFGPGSRAFAPARTAIPATGQPGSIRLIARDSVSLTGQSSIDIDDRAAGDVSRSARPGIICIETPNLSLSNSRISTRSAGNRDARAIQLTVPGRLMLSDGSSITTSANTGDGGSIAIQGPTVIRLADSRIRSSVAAGNGDGGDIAIQADTLLLQTGLIEADAVSGNGGDVSLNIKTLLASGNAVNGRDVGANFLAFGDSAGTWQAGQFAGNIIRAVSRSGVSGTIQFSSPQLNLNGTIANLGAPLFGAVDVTPDACRKEPGSTLTVEGRGGLPPRPRDWMLY